jgi:hypothetical protein
VSPALIEPMNALCVDAQVAVLDGTRSTTERPPRP